MEVYVTLKWFLASTMSYYYGVYLVVTQIQPAQHTFMALMK